MRKATYRTIITIALFLATPLIAENGRDFAGFYDVAGVTYDGETVSLTFSAEIFNYSGSDVASATIYLTDSMGIQDCASALDIRIDYRRSTKISGAITIPKEEYELWLQGIMPSLFVEYQHGNGESVHRPVELSFLPGGNQS